MTMIAAPRPLPFLARMLLAAALACACAAALGADALERAKQRGKLVAGIQYVVPEYQAGAKFRTPEALDTALLEDAARRLQLPLATVRAQSGKADITLAALPENAPRRDGVTVIPTGYAAGPMAIMRTDTSIKTWEQLKGRKVCVSAGGRYVGMMETKYGAIELPYAAPADALIALRTGLCDAAVHDSTLLEELIKLPEWKKFSARLPPGPRSMLAFVVPASDKKTAAFLTQVANDWKSGGFPDQLMKKAVRNIAFEVYLDQEVPDCH
ncbi:MAG: ABC transporter substrate-binding protein [Bacillota bacterium]